MERLIIQFSTGSEYYSQDEQVPVIYESAEAFLVDLEKIVKKYSEELTNYQTAWRNFYETDRKLSTAKNTKELQSIQKELYDMEVAWKKISSPEPSFMLGGSNFDASSFIEANKVCLPEVLTLDEYFAEAQMNVAKPKLKL